MNNSFRANSLTFTICCFSKKTEEGISTEQARLLASLDPGWFPCPRMKARSSQPGLTVSGLHQLSVAILGGLFLASGSSAWSSLRCGGTGGVVGVTGDIRRGRVVFWVVENRRNDFSWKNWQLKLHSNISPPLRGLLVSNRISTTVGLNIHSSSHLVLHCGDIPRLSGPADTFKVPSMRPLSSLRRLSCCSTPNIVNALPQGRFCLFDA